MLAVGERRSIHIDGLSHLTAIPVASRIGPLLMSSVIAPFDPGTRDVPDTVDEQVRNVFTHVGSMLDAAGARWDDVIKMNFWVPSADDRPALEAPWLEHFPDETSRPARHTQVSADARVVTADFTAYVT
jgi:enamine deaminase RidA (YjgF/YER057c/UK114 family)